jgi:simple sugar transport system substrate-binding protein
MKKKLSVFFLFAIMVGAIFLSGQFALANEDFVIANVVKSVAFNWFLRWEEGMTRFSEDFKVKAFMEGPSVADSAQQVAIIEDLIAQGVDAFVISPYGVKEHEPVQKKAMDEGIVVVTYEASFVNNADYDVEPFDNVGFGEETLKELAVRMDGKGKYVQFVGSLTNASHNEWTDAALAYQLEHYPEMELVGKYESKEDLEVAYNVMKDLLKTYPDIKGVSGSAAGDVVGAGRAIEEMGLSDQIAVVGTSIPSYAGELLKTGAVDLAMSWDPAIVGYASNVVAYKLLKGEPITNGLDLGIPGYESIKVEENESGIPVVYGSGWIKIDANNMDDYPF